MGDIWFVSDHHFNHANILKFTDDKGNLIRPGFKDIDDMNEKLISAHNSVVSDQDKVYFGGDVGKNVLPILKRLNGKKRLILGNHDKLTPPEANHFQKISSWRFFGECEFKFVLSHYPLHPMSFEYKGGNRVFNVHGHIHEKFVMKENDVDLRYKNICIEKLEYWKPINMETLQSNLRQRYKVLGEK